MMKRAQLVTLASVLCSFAALLPGDATAQTQVKPRFVVILDTSGSMLWTPQQITLGPSYIVHASGPTAGPNNITCATTPPACTAGAACAYSNGGQSTCGAGQHCGPNGICSGCGTDLDCTGGHCVCPTELGEQVCQASDLKCHIIQGVPTHGDGSRENPGCDINNDGQDNDSKMFQAKGALTNIFNAYSEAEYALERYNQLTGGLVAGTACNDGNGALCSVFCSTNAQCNPNGGSNATCVPIGGGQSVCQCAGGTGLTCGADFRCNNCPTGPDGANFFSCLADPRRPLNAGTKQCLVCPVDWTTAPPVDDLTNGFQDKCFGTTHVGCDSAFQCSQCDNAISVARADCNQYEVDQTCTGDPALLGGSGTITCSTAPTVDMCTKYSGVYTNAGACVNGTGEFLVDFPAPTDPTYYTRLFSWINNTEADGNELRASGATPLAGALTTARTQLQTDLGGDSAAACRSYNVIFITDGAETCGGNAPAAATALRTTPIGGTGQNKDVKTFVIGFSLCPPSDPNCADGLSLNAIASSGGTGSAFLVNDQVSLQATLAGIIESSIPRELCNCQDDNCNGQCDENFPQVGVSNVACSNQHSATQCTVGVGACQRSGIFKCSTDGTGVICAVNDGGSACQTQTVLQPGTPGTETCPNNGIDDDCNGIVDDVPGGCPTPTPEVCNGRDDDLDSLIDEWKEIFPCANPSAPPYGTNCRCVSGTTVSACPGSGALPDNCGCLPSCGSNVGTCQPGLEECLNGVLSCVGQVGPQTEICDGLDNNCNGIVDDVPPVACISGTNTGCTPNGSGGFNCQGICRPGTRTCGACNDVGPGPEIACNGLDDNCNGQVDEPAGQPCYPAGTQGCVSNGSGGFTCTGTCHAGTFQCQGGALVCVGAGTPSAEICDGLDNNCDGQVDNFTCGAAQGICTARCTNPNVSGSTSCTAGQPCTCNTHFGQTTETCNGQDDDCDGIIDNNLGAPFNQPCAPTGATCNLGAGTCCGICTPGTLRCISGAPVCDGATGPRQEVCNGLDDNCDCTPDNNIPGLGGACGSNVGACRQGSFQCVSGSVQCTGSTGPMPETCNGIDDDCDGVIDDNVPGAGNPCYTAGPSSNCNLTANPPRCNGQCRPGQLVCSGGAMSCQGQIGPSTELCNGLDDDCDGVVDNGFNVGGPCTVMFGSCPSMGTLVCTPNGQGTVCNAPPVSSSPEICDGIDNNCDGVADEPNQIWPCPTSAPNPANCICPTGRSCGNTADLAFCYCPPQCGLSVGECLPGHLECQSGQQLCVGGTQPQPEICNCLDDNCNGIVDDNPMGEGDSCPPTDSAHTCNSAGVGCRADEQCDTATGNCIVTHVTPPSTCRNGHKHCQSTGTNTCGFVCEGAVDPTPEICDGLDNDCDGVIDNGAQCPPMYSCISGSCQPNCQISEFPCTADRRCIDPSTGSECSPPRTNCVCLPNLCANANCDPATQNCIILNGMAQCVDRCPAGHCTAPLQCDPSTGMCLDCYSSQFTCPTGQICIDNPGHCVPDPCANITCNAGEVCSNGQCIPSCNPPCPANEVCGADGQCHMSPCPQCAVGEVCNPATGQCQNDMCMTQVCPAHQVCIPQTGTCEPDPCVTTTCPACQACTTAFNGAASCQADPNCVPPPTINFTGIGGGGCACDVADQQAPSGIWLFGIALGIVLVRRGRGGRR